MDELIAFLTARLDEDEQIAKVATTGPWRHNPDKHWRKPGTSWFEEAVFAGPDGKEATCVAGTGETDDPQSLADAKHIARHDPARDLADVAAKRKLIEYITSPQHLCPKPQDDENYWWEGGERVYRPIPCGCLRALAAPYADHPDYREEWRSA